MTTHIHQALQRESRVVHFSFALDLRGFTKSAAAITKKNSRIPSQGIHAGMAGTTVIVRGAEAVWFPKVASIAAVKFWGAAAGVASTMSCPPLVP